MEFKSVIMNKSVTIINHKTKEIKTINYNELEKELENDNRIMVTYIFADLKRRKKQLEKLGYILEQEMIFDDEAPYSKIKELYKKEK